MTPLADQLSAFLAINGGFGIDRVVLSAGGDAGLTRAAIIRIGEIRGSGVAHRIVLTDVNTGFFIDARGDNDTVPGTLQADLIKGNTGNDALSGSKGNDTLNGG